MVEEKKAAEAYKKTELGLIPIDWEVVPLENIIDKNIKWGFTGGPFGSNLKSSDYTEDGVRVIQLQNIGDGKFHDLSAIYTSEEKANELISCNIYPNEIIMSKMGNPVARACFVPDTEERYLMCSDGIRLVVDENRFSKKFVHDYINSKYFRDRAIESSTGSTRQRIGLQVLKKLLIIAPTLPEQKAIAEIFKDIDSIILSIEKLIAKKKNIKQGTMQQLLTGKKRLNGFAGEWEKSNIENICLTNGLVRGPFGGALKKDFFVKEGIKVYEQKNAIYRNHDIGEYYINNDKFNELKRFEVNSGDFIISCSGTIGKIYQIPPEAKRGIINQALLKIRVDNNKIYDKYFFYYFEWDKFQEKILDNTQGGAMQNLIGMPIFRRIEIMLPTIDEQKAIAEVLGDLDSEIEVLQQKLDKYKAIKEGMMQELLMGRTRLI